MIELFGNGPLPEQFRSSAYFTTRKSEFALPSVESLEYLQWCVDNGYRILGLETWRPTRPGPTVVVGVGADGGYEVCSQAIQKYIDKFGEDIVFNIWVHKVIGDPLA